MARAGRERRSQSRILTIQGALVGVGVAAVTL